MQLLHQQLSQLKLSGLQAGLTLQQQQPAQYQELSFEERLSLLVEQEISQRENRKIERLIQLAKFRLRAELTNISYHANRQLDKAQIRSLAQGDWLQHHQNLLLTGATGCGKTWLACALGHHYCRQGVTVYYCRLKALLTQLYLAQAAGSYPKLINRLSSTQLLIIDDWGLEPLTQPQRGDLLELTDARYGSGAMLITSQLPVSSWYQMIGESTHADAILDRLLHNGIKLELKGESMRKSMNKLTQADHSS